MLSLLPVLRNTRVELMSIGREEARETDPSQRSSWAVDLFKEGCRFPPSQPHARRTRAQTQHSQGRRTVRDTRGAQARGH